MVEPAYEINFDGLVGPTHNYAGLSRGNLASQRHAQSVSHPRRAALEGLAKMRFLAGLGVRQAVLPPHERPDIGALRRLGFDGPDARVIERAAVEAPGLLAAAYSASAMWAANAATVSPAPDTADGRAHFTPANLVSQFHRSLEPPTTQRVLKRIFADESAFAHHDPLPAAPRLGDEGAANHTRLCAAHSVAGLELFVYGGGDPAAAAPPKFPARQAREASEAVARLHGLAPSRTLFARQAPTAIDAGAFHNDVVAVGNENVMLCHASAYADAPQLIAQLRQTFAAVCAGPLFLIEIPEGEVPLADAIDTYLFNSQVVTLPDGSMSLLAPIECQEHERVRQAVARIVQSENPITAAYFLGVRQSMHNGGGPACLRLRVVLTERQLHLMHQRVVLTDALYSRLVTWVEKNYRESLAPADLADPRLLDESRTALDELTAILGLGAIYPFQL